MMPLLCGVCLAPLAILRGPLHRGGKAWLFGREVTWPVHQALRACWVWASCRGPRLARVSA